MAFLVGPRQVGKTSLCRTRGTYLDWDNLDDRALILKGPAAVADRIGLDRLTSELPVVAFDELHKNARWKSFLKGFFDTYEDRVKILVTGSSRLDAWRKGGDSLMGRYFLYRVHPFSVGEVLHPRPSEDLLATPEPISEEEWNALWRHGGFPEPFARRQDRFTTRWRGLRRQQLLREDVREIARIHELGHLELLTKLLADRSGGQLVLSNLAQDIQVSVDTVRRWVELLVSLHYGFVVRPWFASVAKSLRKEPKWFLRDWSEVSDEGARFETLVACHLLKAVETWQDFGLGQFELRYLRDKAMREVDFLVVRDGKPWFLVEAKLSATTLSPSLRHFQEQIKAPHAFQVVSNLDFVAADPFTRKAPTVVPARTLLSMLP
ncbi:MAG: ATP-binding protein [Fibrobacteres bacterium]|nr:ATP-binding protein [Fibrobacterota bacterium]